MGTIAFELTHLPGPLSLRDFCDLCSLRLLYNGHVQTDSFRILFLKITVVFSSLLGYLKHHYKALSTPLFLPGFAWLFNVGGRLHHGCCQGPRYRHAGGEYDNAQHPNSQEASQSLTRFRFLHS